MDSAYLKKPPRKSSDGQNSTPSLNIICKLPRKPVGFLKVESSPRVPQI